MCISSDIDNCIQLKIDNLIREANTLISDDNGGKKNEVLSLMKYSQCIDLYDLMGKYSNIQRHELLLTLSLLSLSLNIPCNIEDFDDSIKTPTSVFLKSVFLFSVGKQSDSRKYIVKFKHISAGDERCGFEGDLFEILIMYVLNYEENIIIREIEILENKYTKFIYNKLEYNNIVLLYIKIQIYKKLQEKFLNIDKKRVEYYKHIYNKMKEQWNKFNNSDTEYLENNGITVENIIKPIIMISNDRFINYRPKPLIEYKNTFNKGFGLFFELFKICKIIKLKIYTKRYKKIFQSKNSNKYNNDNIDNNNNSKISTENTYETKKEYQESIKNLCNSIWLSGFLQKDNNLLLNSKSNNISNSNYYIEKGYYNKYNINAFMLQYLNYNKNNNNNNNMDISETNFDVEKELNNESMNLEKNHRDIMVNPHNSVMTPNSKKKDKKENCIVNIITEKIAQKKEKTTICHERLLEDNNNYNTGNNGVKSKTKDVSVKSLRLLTQEMTKNINKKSTKDSKKQNTISSNLDIFLKLSKKKNNVCKNNIEMIKYSHRDLGYNEIKNSSKTNKKNENNNKIFSTYYSKNSQKKIQMNINNNKNMNTITASSNNIDCIVINKEIKTAKNRENKVFDLSENYSNLVKSTRYKIEKYDKCSNINCFKNNFINDSVKFNKTEIMKNNINNIKKNSQKSKSNVNDNSNNNFNRINNSKNVDYFTNRQSNVYFDYIKNNKITDKKSYKGGDLTSSLNFKTLNINTNSINKKNKHIIIYSDNNNNYFYKGNFMNNHKQNSKEKKENKVNKSNKGNKGEHVEKKCLSNSNKTVKDKFHISYTLNNNDLSNNITINPSKYMICIRNKAPSLKFLNYNKPKSFLSKYLNDNILNNNNFQKHTTDSTTNFMKSYMSKGNKISKINKTTGYLNNFSEILNKKEFNKNKNECTSLNCYKSKPKNLKENIQKYQRKYNK